MLKKSITLGTWARSLSVCGDYVAIGGNNSVVYVYSTVSYEMEESLSGHDMPVLSICLLSDGLLAVSGDAGGRLMLWSVADEKRLSTTSDSCNAVTDIILSPDGGELVTVSNDNTARVYNATSLRLIRTLASHSAPITSAAFSKQTGELITSGLDFKAFVYDSSYNILSELKGAESCLYACALTDDGKHAATLGGDGVLRIYTV